MAIEIGYRRKKFTKLECDDSNLRVDAYENAISLFI